MRKIVQEKMNLTEQGKNGASHILKHLEMERMLHSAKQEITLLKEKCIELERQHQQTNLENQQLKLQLEQLNKKYESTKMRMADMHNQLARGVQDTLFR